MSLKNSIISYLAERLPNNTILAEYYRRNSGKKAQWERQPVLLTARDIDDWKLGVAAATDPDNPSRGELMRFYESLLLDNHLGSVIDTRIMRVQRSSYKIVNDNNEENEELKNLLERPWHDELIRLSLMQRYQGTTLIEMFELNEDMELETVTEIPQSNFNAPKGIILKREMDQEGIPYKSGSMQNYYLQCGGDWDLGMLNQLAMIVLAKKLSLGSWMSYIDKFGVPPIFAITDRMDTGRRDELFEMMEHFRQNMFVILQGNERIEVPSNYQVDAHNTFKALIENICNKEISKRVLGGTAITDENAFVGSSEVQERVAGDRYEADKLLYKNIFNSKIRPKLVKLSPIYAEFATHKLIWDNQETLNIKDYIDAVQKLSGSFEFDTEEIKNRTGLPITGIKTVTSPFTGIGAKAEKKKPESKSNKGPQSYFDIYAATLNQTLRRLAEDIYEGRITPNDIDRDLLLKTYTDFAKQAETGWGTGFYTDDIARKMRENVLQFSGAKIHRTLEEFSSVITGDKEAYQEEINKILNLQYGSWLESEKTYLARSAQMAKDWQQFTRDQDIYKNLVFRTMRDSLVRPDHAALEGFTAAIDDPIWNWYSPPLGFGCRCFLEQTNAKVTPVDPEEPIEEEFRTNVGKTGIPFTDKHSYFQMNDQDKSIILQSTERVKEYIPYNRTIDLPNDHKIRINDFADLKDMPQNMRAAEKISQYLDKDIYLRPHFEGGILHGYKSPEFGIGSHNSLGDLKTFSKGNNLPNFIDNSFASANRQGCSWVVLDISEASGTIDQTIRRRLAGALNENINRNIKQVIFIRGNKVGKISRKQVAKRQYNELLESM